MCGQGCVHGHWEWQLVPPLTVAPHRLPRSYSAAAVDTWSMGVTLYLLITGHYPFEDPAASHNVLATLNNAKAGKYRPLPASVSEACRDLIGRLLTVDPAKRITLSAALAHPWLVAHGVGCAASSSESAGDVDVQAGSAAPAAAAPMPEAFSFPQPLPHMVTPATPTVVGAPDAPKAPGLLGPSSIAIVASAATAPGSSCSPVAAPVSPSFSRGGPAAGEAEAEAGGKRQRLFAFGCFSGLLNFLF